MPRETPGASHVPQSLTLAKEMFVDLRRYNVCFCFTSMRHQSGLLIFFWSKTHSEKMDIVDDFVEQSYNNGKPWKSSRILRGNLRRFLLLHVFFFLFFSCAFPFFHFRHFYIFCIFHFLFLCFPFSLFFIICFFPVVGADAKTTENRREILLVQRTIFL